MLFGLVHYPRGVAQGSYGKGTKGEIVPQRDLTTIEKSEIRYNVHTQDTRLFVKYLSKIGYENTNICGIPQFLVQYIFT